MIVYILVLILCVFFEYLANNQKNKRTSIALSFIPFFLLFFISAIRVDVGADYSGTYTDTFYKIMNGVQNVRTDIGFFLLNDFLIFIGGNLQWVFVVTSFIINLFILLSINNQSKLKPLSYFIYICGVFYFFSMNGIRQSIAMSIFYFSFKYIKNKNLSKFLVANLIGSLFHSSAILFLPIYFLTNHKFRNTKTYILIILITTLTTGFIINFLSPIILDTKYGMYITNGHYTPISSLNLSSIFNAILFSIFLHKKNELDQLGNTYLTCHFVALLFSIFLTSVPLMMRIFISFRFIDFLSVPYLLNNIKNKRRSLLLMTIYLSYFIYFIYSVGIKNANLVLPYKSILSV